MKFELDVTIPETIVAIMAAVDALFYTKGGSNEPAGKEINTQADYDFEVEQIKKMKSDLKLVIVAREDLTKPLNKEKTRIIDLFQPFQLRCARYERDIKARLTAYRQAEERKRAEKQAAADARARKEREKLEERAKKHAEKGNEEKADALIETAIDVQPVAVQVAPVTKGVSSRGTWSAEIIDKRAFIEAALKDKTVFACIDINLVKLNKLAVMLKEEFDVPGAKASKSTSVAIRV